MSTNWNKRFMEIAEAVGTWSSCYKSTKDKAAAVGAVIVKDKRIIATGYNGAPAGMTPCTERGECFKAKLGIAHGDDYCYAIHAEQNAILQAAKFGTAIDGCTMYCTTMPCPYCTKSIINAGIKKVIYNHDYPNKWRDELLKQSSVIFEKFKEEKN